MTKALFSQPIFYKPLGKLDDAIFELKPGKMVPVAIGGEMTKAEILDSLQNHLWTRLKGSNHRQIGVFAMRAIPKGTDPFKACRDAEQIIEIAQSEIDELELPDAVLTYIKDFFPLTDGGYYQFPGYPPAAIDQSYFLNHSDAPNMITPDGGITFVTAELVHAGAELTVDYRTYSYTADDDFIK